MKSTWAYVVLVALFTVNITFLPRVAYAQGVLTPPGAPAPTMKTLAQIEPRTPIYTATNISNPGSYYLTTNINVPSGNGITISANNVTLDLNGFALTGNASPINSGISFTATHTNVTVRNGTISGWYIGVYDIYYSSQNTVLEGLSISSCAANGIDAAQARIHNCFSSGNGADGIDVVTGGEITDCDVVSNSLNGIYAFNCLVRNCNASGNNGWGIYVNPGTVEHCLVQNSARSGILLVGNGGKAVGNDCIGNNTSANTIDAGIYVNAALNRVEDNHVDASGYAGIAVSTAPYSTNNVIIKNSVGGNGAKNYIFNTSQVVGPIVSNTVSGIITNANPWANFSY